MKFDYKLVYPNAELLIKKGFGLVSNIPCIFHSAPGYHRNGSMFLIDRALGVWSPGMIANQSFISVPPTPISIKNYGDRLCNFLSWCDHRSLEPLALEYSQDLVGRYQKEMAEGIWSLTKKGLSPSTINSRVATACEYINWASAKGLRSEFHVPSKIIKFKTPSAISSVGHLTKDVTIRKGKMREIKSLKQIPSESEVKIWLERMYEQKGLVRGLIAELILETAIRRSEAAGWRIDTIPLDRSDWDIRNPEAPINNQFLKVKIRYGCKGKNYGQDNGDKIGPEGVINIPLLLAEKIDAYRKKERAAALRLQVKKGRTASEQFAIRDASVHLFLDQETGLRINQQSIYDGWRSVEKPKGWSPHRARDFWACTTLWNHLKSYSSMIDKIIEGEQTEKNKLDIMIAAEYIVSTIIKPQLRHVSRETTIIYLQWVVDRMNINLNIAHEKMWDGLDQASN